MLNRIVLIGRLVSDPQMRYTSSGIPVANMRIAVDRPYTNQQGQRETDFIDIVCWRGLAETVANNLHKGRLIAVDGRLQIRQYEWEGQRRQAAEVYADTVRFLDSKRDFAGSQSPPPHESESGYFTDSSGFPDSPGLDDPGPDADDVPF
ncbi:MAG: single-stranded DNA-binding protein [Firmicutes bacterium]|nr:single-stranded DNA-binding protein [Bacillota bacterium]